LLKRCVKKKLLIVGAFTMEVAPPIFIPGVGVMVSVAAIPLAAGSIYYGFCHIQEGVELITQAWEEMSEERR
jgi:hypothetical protein